MAFSDWSTVAASNGTTLGVNIAEGCAPGNVNDALRKAMADIRSAIDPTLATFLSSTSLSSARTALGVPGTTASVTAFNALTNAANLLPYMTGSDAWATTTLSSFARTLLDDGDAAAALVTLGAIGGATASASANTGSISIPLTASFTLLIQWGSGSLAGNSTGTVTFGTAYSVAPFAMVNGGGSDSDEGDVHNVGAASTTGISIANGAPSTDSYTWLALGKA
jgi:hypothetical protein